MLGLHTRNRPPMLRRALKASLVALVLGGGGYLWQQAASARIAERAEQARVNALKMTPAKLQALEREAAIAAAAKAYAEKHEAEKQMEAHRIADERASIEAKRSFPDDKG